MIWKPYLGGDDVADLVLLQTKGDVFKVLDHLAAGYPAQISAFLAPKEDRLNISWPNRQNWLRP